MARLRDSRRKAWAADLHPRGHGGKFTSKGGPAVITKAQRTKLPRLKGSPEQAALIQSKQHQDMVKKAHLEMLASLAVEQRQRLFKVLGTKKPGTAVGPALQPKPTKPETPPAPKAEPKTEPKPAVITKPQPVKEEGGKHDFSGVPDEKLVATKLKRGATIRKVASTSSVTVDPSGKLELWKNSDEGKFDKTYRYRQDKNFEYKVNHAGKELVLNRHTGVMEFQGEVVKGIPPTDQNLRKVATQSLFDRMVNSVGYVEDKANRPPSPDWSPRKHGSVDDKSLVRSQKGAGDYGGMQIHHINQWARESFGAIQERFGYARKIDPEEAKKAMEGLLIPESKVGSGYAINVRDKKDRELVILAGGLHDLNSPLYQANHPLGYHPETGKLMEFGIPKSASSDGNRDEFNQWSDGFWRQYYRREAYVYRQEIARRVKAGEIKPEDVQSHVATAYEKAKNTAKMLQQLSKDATEHNKALKEELVKRGLDSKVIKKRKGKKNAETTSEGT